MRRRFFAEGPGFEVTATSDSVEVAVRREIHHPADARALAAAIEAAAICLESSLVQDEEARRASADRPSSPPPSPREREPNPLDYLHWFSIKQAKEHVGIGERTILDACRSGELKANQRVFGGRWRIHRDDLERWARGEKP